jgi:putative hydrolase of the HAD superfamily
MQVFPQYSGPMAEWPEVAEMEGVVEALEKMLGHYKMVVATNAAASSVEQVWKALRRAGLGEYFTAAFTPRELGSAKPAPSFFHQIESILSRKPDQLVMVGDDYNADVLGAKAAGWRAIWLNQPARLAPAALPLHDAEIQSMRELPSALNQLHYPDHLTSLAWLVQNGATFTLLSHLSLVSSIAYLLAAWLRNTGQRVNPVLAHRGGLLHDLSKIESLHLKTLPGTTISDHARMAHERLLRYNQPELAEIADRHMLFQEPEDPRQPVTWEQKLVHFADKLAEGSRLVAPQERVEALRGRYPAYAAELEASLPALLTLQEEICAHLSITPEALISRLRSLLS